MTPSGPRITGASNAASAAGKRLWRRVLFSEHLVLGLSLAYVVFLCCVRPDLASPASLVKLLSNMLPLLVVAVGQTFVLIAGGIDLSVTAVIGLSSIIGGLIMTGDGGLLAGGALAVPAGLLAMLAVGACLGAINGAAVAGLGMPPFIVTLTVLTFFRGFARWINQSRSIYSLPAAVNELGGGTWWQIPRAVVLVVPLVLAAHWILRRGLVGRWLHAVGLNGRAALVSGVPVAGTIFFSYVFCGCCASMASVIYTGRLETASAEHGDGIFLDVIAAVVIGGTSLFGGKGTIPGTIQGVFFITLIDTSLNWFNRSNFTIAMVKGGVILLAALLDALRRRLLSRA